MPRTSPCANLLFGLALCLFSMLSNAQINTSPVRIGLIFPLTGGSADMGNSALVGAQVGMSARLG